MVKVFNDKYAKSAACVILCDTAFNIIDLNPTATAFFRTQRKSGSKINLVSQFKFEAVNVSSRTLLDIVATKKKWEGTISFCFQNNYTQYFRGIISTYNHGKRKCLLIQFKKNKQNSAEFIESELLFNNHFKKILNSSNEGYALMNRDYIIESINKRAQEITKITHGQVMHVGHSMFEYLPTDYHPYCIAITEQVLAGEKVTLKAEYPGLNGKKTYLNTDYIPAYNDEGNIIGVIINSVDISEQHYNKLQIEESAFLMQSILSSTTEGMGMVGLDYKVVLYNESMNRLVNQIFRIRKKISIGADFFDFVVPERREYIKTVFERVIQGEKVEIQHKFYDKWMLASYTPIIDKEKKVIAVCLSIREITDIINKQIQIEQREIQYNTTLNNLTEIVILLDSDFSILQINQAGEQLLNIDQSITKETAGFSFSKLGFRAVNAEDALYLNHRNWKKISDHKKDLLVYKMIKNVRTVFLINISVINNIASNNNPGRQYVISLRDITRIEKMSETINQLSLIAKNISNGVIISNIHGHIQWVNNGFTKMFGYSIDEVIGKEPCSVLEGKDSNAATSVFIKKNIKKRIEFSCEILNYHKDGREVWVELSKQPVFDNKGRFIQYYSLLTDITERKKLEKQLEDERIENQQNISRSIYKAHEDERSFLSKELHDSVNQKLTASIFNLSRFYNNSASEPELLNNSLKLLKDSMNEIRSLSKRLVAQELLQLGFEDAVKQIVYSSVQSFKNIRCNIKVSPRCEHIIPDEMKVNIFRIVQEQMQNIIKHSKATKVSIEVDIADTGEIKLTTMDNGKGFNVQKKRKGVGLINIMNRVESFKGKCTIDSALNKGCKYFISFPVN